MHTRSLREAKEGKKTKGVQHIDAPASQPLNSGSDYDFLELLDPPPLPDDDGEALIQLQIRSFWINVKLHPVKDLVQNAGTTCIEFFILFTLHGGQSVKACLDGSSHIKPRFWKAFKAFIASSKAIFKYASACTGHLVRALPNG